MAIRFSRPGWAAIVFLGIAALLPAPSAFAESAGAAALRGAAALTDVTRPRARDVEAVTVASRSVDVGTEAMLSAINARKAMGPRELDVHALDAMPAAKGGDDLLCLAQAIYFEARGEPLEGQIAVAEVVLNRVDDGRFPDTVCGVTNQGVGSGRACQFSYACDGRSDVMKTSTARTRSEKLAGIMLSGRDRAITDGATYFHTRSIRPSWAKRMTRTTSVGHHHFYRHGRQVAG